MTSPCSSRPATSSPRKTKAGLVYPDHKKCPRRAGAISAHPRLPTVRMKETPPGSRAGPRTSPSIMSPGCLDRDDSDDFEGDRVYDHYLVLVEEASIAAELRCDHYDLFRHQEHVEAAG